jgi:hypothetical protein
MKHALLPMLVLLSLALPAVAQEYSLPFKVGGQTLSVDTSEVDWTTLGIFGAGSYGIWSWIKSRKGGSAQKFFQALSGLWGKLPSDKKPVTFDGTVGFESGESYTFHIDLAGKMKTKDSGTTVVRAVTE